MKDKKGIISLLTILVLLVCIVSITSCISTKTKKVNQSDTNVLKKYSSVLFWNVDTQVDFMKASGKLYVQDAETIEPVLAQLTSLAEKHNIIVVNSCDYHNENTLELSDTPDFVKTFPPHCM